MSDQRTPSLLEPQSRGGEDAGRGFDFQDHFLVSQIPRWLERDGFIGVLHEAIGDIEVKMFSPEYGEGIELIEAKNRRLTPALFWSEIDRFYAADQGSPNTFYWFRLVAPEISDDIAPLQNGLRRIRSPYGFYPKDSGVMRNTRADFAQLVAGQGKPPEYAEFLLNRVLIETEFGIAQTHGEALFRQSFGQCMPEYGHLSYQLVSAIYSALLKLVSPRNTPITRKAIEETVRVCIPPNQPRPYLPVRLYTAQQKDDTERKELVLDWARFSGKDLDAFPKVEDWNVGIVGQLVKIKAFVLNHRNTRELVITGGRRLSAALALGAVFSATSGFAVAVQHRDGVWWKTSDYQRSEAVVPLKIEFPQEKGKELVVSIGLPNDIRQTVENYLQRVDISHLPLLNIVCPSPVENAQQANSVVSQTKEAILHTLSATQATRIHLFCAIPSFVALVLVFGKWKSQRVAVENVSTRIRITKTRSSKMSAVGR